MRWALICIWPVMGALEIGVTAATAPQFWLRPRRVRLRFLISLLRAASVATVALMVGAAVFAVCVGQQHLADGLVVFFMLGIMTAVAWVLTAMALDAMVALALVRMARHGEYLGDDSMRPWLSRRVRAVPWYSLVGRMYGMDLAEFVSRS